MMKDAFYFMIKAIFVLKIFKRLSYAHIEKRLYYKYKVNIRSQPG